MPYDRQYFLNIIPEGSNVNTIRAGSPVLAKAVAVAPRVGPPVHLDIIRFPVRGGTTMHPHLLYEEPIAQLLRTRNPRPYRILADWHADKSGDFTGLVDRISIKRLHAQEQQKHRNRHKREVENSIIKHGPRVTLGRGINAHLVAMKPRVKPALPAGRSDVPALTVPHGYVGGYLESQMPHYIPAYMRAQAHAAKLGRRARLPVGAVDGKEMIEITHDASVMPTSTPPHEDLKTSGGRLLFLVAAVAVAYMVLR